ncbi:hypothetical protein BKA63DRAFT_527504 [Paraphoma chrysanthemicola]|nr:hypothetical protein BKA63DRAFT_527504 [Paraphoma chrysanthemicola]
MNVSKTVPPLLRLPVELRYKIYSHSLSYHIFSIYCWRRHSPFGFATRIIQKRRHFLALLSVSRQIYSETRLLPFMLNAFRFKSEDAFQSWFNKFSAEQRESTQEVHLVTWMARHMIEGHAWRSSPLHLVFPIDRVPGLRRLNVEVRGNGKVKDCVIDGCHACEQRGEEVALEEERFSQWVAVAVGKIDIGYERVLA